MDWQKIKAREIKVMKWKAKLALGFVGIFLGADLAIRLLAAVRPFAINHPLTSLLGAIAAGVLLAIGAVRYVKKTAPKER